MTRLWSICTHNASLKVLSVLLAAALWVASSNDPVTETTLRIPVEFVNLAPNLQFMTNPSAVELRIQGPSRAIRAATPADFAVRVDLAEMSGPADQTISLGPQQIVAPAFVKVVEITPPQVRVNLNPIGTKR